MKIKELGVVKVESVFIQEDFPPQDAYVLRQGTAQYTKELTAMISLSIFQDIMASYKANIKILRLFVGLFPHNTFPTLNKV